MRWIWRFVEVTAKLILSLRFVFMPITILHCRCKNWEMLSFTLKTSSFFGFPLLSRRGESLFSLSIDFKEFYRYSFSRLWLFKERGTICSKRLALFLQLRAISLLKWLWNAFFILTNFKIFPNSIKIVSNCLVYTSSQIATIPLAVSQVSLPWKIS